MPRESCKRAAAAAPSGRAICSARVGCAPVTVGAEPTFATSAGVTPKRSRVRPAICWRPVSVKGAMSASPPFQSAPAARPATTPAPPARPPTAAFLSLDSSLATGCAKPKPAPTAAAPGSVAAPGTSTAGRLAAMVPVTLPATPAPVRSSGASRALASSTSAWVGAPIASPTRLPKVSRASWPAPRTTSVMPLPAPAKNLSAVLMPSVGSTGEGGAAGAFCACIVFRYAPSFLTLSESPALSAFRIAV